MKLLEAKMEGVFFLGTIVLVGGAFFLIWAGKMIYYSAKLLKQEIEKVPFIQSLEHLLDIL